MMDSYKAVAILAFCTQVQAAALPQLLPLDAEPIAAALPKPALVAIPSEVPTSVLPSEVPTLVLPSEVPTLVIPAEISVPVSSVIPVTTAEVLSPPDVLLPGPAPLPVAPIPVPVPLPVAGVPPTEAVANAVDTGSSALKAILNLLDKSAPVIPLLKPQAQKRQLPGLGSPISVAGSTASGLGGLPAIANPLAGALGSIPSVPLPSVASLLSVPVPSVASLLSIPLPSVGLLPISSVPSVPSVPSVASVPPVSTLGASVVSSALGSVPSSAASAAPTTPNLNPAPINGIPGTDPVGAFSIAVIATLLSLLKKDPLSLFAPAASLSHFMKRDFPELWNRDVLDHEKRQLSSIPNLSGGIPGVGVGSLPLSGLPGVSPDLAFLVGSIAKNIAVPGGVGLGAVTSSILSVLNGIVPNFIFQLPVVQDAVPTFGVLQLLSAINPTKFKDLAGLTSLSSLQQAASTITPTDLAFIKTLPSPSDPTNLITTIMTLADNILSAPGNVVSLRATVAILALKNLGLAIPS